MEHHEPMQYLAIIISEVKSSSRELYPLTKNYPMALLSVGSKKLIVYQLEALLPLTNIAKIVIVTSEEEKLLPQFVESQFLPSHRDYPHKIEFSIVKDIANSFSALKHVLADRRQAYKGYLLLHSDIINAVSLQSVIDFHELKTSDLTLLHKAKRELGELEKKLPEGQIQTEIDNVLVAENSQCLFIDMADEVDNSGVIIDPTIFKQARKAAFRRMVDSKTYIFNDKITSILLGISSEDIYEIKPELIHFLVQNQTNQRLLQLANNQKQISPLKIFIHCNEQDSYIRKIASKKVYETLNFDSIIRGAKQKEVLMPTSYSDRLDERKEFKGNASIAQSATIAAGAKIRRSCVGPNCKIGKNVELINTILLQNVQVKDNCKILQSVIGCSSLIGEGASLKNVYAQSGCRVADGAKIQSEVLIKNQ